MKNRIEKWRLYRQEILNDGLMLDKLANESSAILKYKQKIDELNPKILKDMPKTEALANLVSINKKDNQDYESLKEFASLIDEQKIKTNIGEIDKYIQNDDFISILDEDGKKISSNWLSDDKNLKLLLKTGKSLDNLSITWNNFQSSSKDQLDRLNKLIQNKKIYDEFQQYKITPTKDEEEKQTPFKTLFFVSLGLSAFFLLIMLILLVFVLVYYV